MTYWYQHQEFKLRYQLQEVFSIYQLIDNKSVLKITADTNISISMDVSLVFITVHWWIVC